MTFQVGIGQDSHRFEEKISDKKCLVGGVVFPDAPGLSADSDGDVVLHAICNAITSVTHVPILGEVAPQLCQKGITDSRVYLEKALETLGRKNINHVALAIEGKRPKFQAKAEDIRKSLSGLLKISIDRIGITFTSGDGLTSFGRGEGLQCFCILTIAEF
ncbi:MAG: 2-C-methyl-D-erythritol 2,4-cyclodiphosphate synthase [Simkaniaceae bacterium]